MPATQTLRRGAQGAPVRQLQERLNERGFGSGKVDGVFGPGTERAVRGLQEAHGLVVDGIVGPGTWAALDDAAAGPQQQPSSEPPPASGTCDMVALESPGGGRITDKDDPSPSDVVEAPGRYRKVPLHRLAANCWASLVADARSAGIPEPLLLPTSGYRSRASQERAWERAKKKYGSEKEARKWVAPPGNSAHQSGRALDCYLGTKNDSANVGAQRKTAAYQWLVENAEGYGFYPYEAEPWHWEYNPPAQ